MRRRALLASVSVKQNEVIPNNMIVYTTDDESIIEPYFHESFGANIVSNTYTDGKGQMVFDGDITYIGDGAFYDCTSLTSIVIPNSVTSIGNMAFCDCVSLTSIVIPNSVTSIGVSAFNSCSSLTSIQIPNSVTSIGNEAFVYCSSLTSVEIGNSVTSIGDGAFYKCTGLTSVYIKPKTPPTLDSYAFDNNASGRKIYVPRASLNAYKAASGWSEYADAIEPYDY